MEHFIKVLENIVTGGVLPTLEVTAVALCGGIILGLLACLGKMSRFIVPKAIASVYIEIIRGTPTLVQALFFYFGINAVVVQLFGSEHRLSALVTGMVVCSINSGAYVAEIFRAGIQSVDKGQREAARSLGMPEKLAMKEIILPQAIRTILPSLGNEFVVLLKETSILSVIGVTEITRVGQLYAAVSYAVFPTYLGVALSYFVLTFTLTRLINMLERRMAVSD